VTVIVCLESSILATSAAAQPFAGAEEKVSTTAIKIALCIAKPSFNQRFSPQYVKKKTAALICVFAGIFARSMI
jgi:hypothetical protein